MNTRPRNANRLAAELSGAVTYRGAPCSRGHPGDRYTTNGTCRDCNLRSALQRFYADPYLNRPQPDRREFNPRPIAEALTRIARLDRPTPMADAVQEWEEA